MTFPRTEDSSLRPSPPSGTATVPWSWRDLALGIAGVLVLLFLLAIAAYPFLEHYGEDSTGGRLTQTVVNGLWYLGSIGLIFLIVRRRGAGWPELGFRPPAERANNRWLALGGAVLLYLLAAYGAVMAYGILVQLLGLDFLEPDQQLPDDTYDSDAVVIATGVLVVLMAPVAEEVLFRGFIFAKLRMHLPFLLAAALSGSVFSFAHADPGLVLPFTAVGMLLAYAYQRTGTLWGSIGVHFCFNLITFLILVLVPEAR